MRDRIVNKVLQRYWRLSRGVTLGAQGLVLDDQGRVLLVRHAYRPGWHFPGGGVEAGETALAALKRELDEETGVTLVREPELFGVYANFRHFPGDHIVLFIVRHWAQPHVPMPNREIVEQAFFDTARLPEGIQPGARARILEVVHARPRTDIW